MRTEARRGAGDGFTLIEVMITMAVVAIGFFAVAGMQVRAVSANAVARKSLHATALAAQRVEALIGMDYDDPALADRTGDGHAGLDADTVETADGSDRSHPPYTVCWNIAPIPESPNPETVNYKLLRVIVAWPERGGRRRLPLETRIAD